MTFPRPAAAARWQRRQLMLIPGGDRGVVVDELLRCFELTMMSCAVQRCAAVLVSVVGPPSFVKKFTDAVLMAMHGGVAYGGEMTFRPWTENVSAEQSFRTKRTAHKRHSSPG